MTGRTQSIPCGKCSLLQLCKYLSVYTVLYPGVLDGMTTGKCVYCRNWCRGGNSPKHSPSCGRAWQVSAGFTREPTVYTTRPVVSKSSRPSEKSPLMAKEIGCSLFNHRARSNLKLGLWRSLGRVTSTTGTRHASSISWGNSPETRYCTSGCDFERE